MDEMTDKLLSAEEINALKIHHLPGSFPGTVWKVYLGQEGDCLKATALAKIDECERLEKERDDAWIKAGDLDEDVTALERDLKAKEAECEQKQAEIERLRGEVERLRRQIGDQGATTSSDASLNLGELADFSPEAQKQIREGLKQEPTIDLGSFAEDD